MIATTNFHLSNSHTTTTFIGYGSNENHFIMNAILISVPSLFLQLFLGYFGQFRFFFKDICIKNAGKNEENPGYFRPFK